MTLIEPIGYPAPYLSTPACSVCHNPDTATFDLYSGRRCASCQPRYNPQTAVDILMSAWADTAAAYVRGWAA